MPARSASVEPAGYFAAMSTYTELSQSGPDISGGLTLNAI